MREKVQPAPLFVTKPCDFCNHGSFVKAYACRAFVYLKGTSMQHYRCEEWTACAICAGLIDGGQWSELAERTVEAFVKQHGTVNSEVPTIREHVEKLHGAFRQYLISEV